MSYSVNNHVKDVVIEKMPILLANMPNICNCERCNCDRLAYVLNTISPKYVVSDKGKIFARITAMDHQFDTDITSAIIKAAELVRERPQH